MTADELLADLDAVEIAVHEVIAHNQTTGCGPEPRKNPFVLTGKPPTVSRSRRHLLENAGD